jgi:hypothetical protein
MSQLALPRAEKLNTLWNREAGLVRIPSGDRNLTAS